MSPPEPSDLERHGASTRLVVLLHAYSSGPERLHRVREVVREAMPDADILLPRLPAAVFSFADPVVVVRELAARIGRLWADRGRSGQSRGYQGIILVGHSLGALLARKLYVLACGETARAPLEPGMEGLAPRDWARSVERIVLLAGMNRGWSISHHMSLLRAAAWTVGSAIGHLVHWLSFSRRTPLIFTIRKGAPFLTNLRIQWLAMRQAAPERKVGSALTIQLLGSIDDLVSPEDNLDLVSGADFLYLDVPGSGHRNVIEMDATAAGRQRAAVFRRALATPREQLEAEGVTPHDQPLPERRMDVTDVIFVIHGIRDLGHWTHKVARRIVRRGGEQRRVYQTETSSYGYFPMLSFLLPWRRRAKVEWLMDQYAEDLALFPNAEFSFVGHSNGTYLLARALRDYPCCRFKHVVLAGSVVRTDYDWTALVESGRIGAVLNYVATADWVVALFPKALEILGIQDLGSAGHDGFRASTSGSVASNAKYVHGGHGAALAEANWDAIAEFVVDGTVRPLPQTLASSRRSAVLAALGAVAPVVWLAILAALVGIGWLLLASPTLPEWLKAVALIAYLWLILKIVTRL